jgi:phosphotriesterase-related protein
MLTMPTMPTNARGLVQTVTGAVDPASLGVTLMHEHLLCDVTPPELAALGGPKVEITPENAFEVRYHWCRHYGNHILDDMDVMASELADFAAAGGGTIVELTIEGISPDPQGLRALAQRSGVKIVAGCGSYIESFSGAALARDIDRQAARIIAAVSTGIDGSDVQAGIIGEIGISDPPTEGELRALTAAALAQQETGASINVHPGRDPASPGQVVAHIKAAGGDPERLVISHLDRTFRTLDEALRLVETGAVAEWDFFGIESAHYPFAPIDLPHDGTRLDLIGGLVARGYGKQIAISQDICTRTRLRRFGGHGYAHIPLNVVPMMRRKGFDQRVIDQLLIETPRRLLTLV